MQRNKSILRYKQKLLIFLSALFIALILQPKQTVYADVDYAAWAASIVNMIGTSNAGGTAEIQNGVTYQRTGYLCYLLTKDGADTGLPAVAFKSPGYVELPGASTIITSRRGHTVTTFEGGEAPWGVTPWAEGGVPTHAPEIRAWFESTELSPSGTPNGYNFVASTWNEDAAIRFGNDEYVLVIETLMHFQFSKPTASISASSFTGVAAQMIRKLYDDDELYDEAVKKGYILDDANSISSAITTIKKDLVDALAERLAETVGSDSARSFVGPPLIGTVPNLIDYKISTDPSMTVFDSYLNKVAPLAERIEYDEAGFTAYSGGTSSQIPNADVKSYGLAMLIIHASSQMQTTCNEPSIPSPHEPPKESDGKVTIVKSYRTKDPTGALIDDGTYSLGDLGTQILIENEQVYQVIGWKTSTITNTDITSISWNPPGNIIQSGTNPEKVMMDEHETCLYVLLEKVEEEIPEPMDYNYHLTQSQITRRIWFSIPDSPLSNMGGENAIHSYKFTWTAPAHTGCTGHTYYTACTGHSCEEANCSAKRCSSSHKCGKDCVSNTEYCGPWDWKDKALKLSINNDYKNGYPSILATKDGWNQEVAQENIVKHYYLNDDSFDRTSIEEQSYTDIGWDYVCILMRGADDLTIAQWINKGSGIPAATSANEDLIDASTEGFIVANRDSGVRKTVDYYEKFAAYFNNETEDGADTDTTWYATAAASVTKIYCANNVQSVTMPTPLAINDIIVKVETYSGSASGGYADTTCNNSDMMTLPYNGYNTSSGRMVPSGGSVTFSPYIQMKYDTMTAIDKPAYVLGEYKRQIIPNDYVEITWNKSKKVPNLTLISSQWTTHAQAVKDWGTDNVLPGGAALGLGIKKTDRQTILLTTYQAIVDGKGKIQAEYTGSISGLDRESAIEAHQAYVASVVAALENTNVQQYVEKNPNKSDAFGGIEVNPGVDISSLGSGAETASTELKYYFRDDGAGTGGNEGDLDVKVVGTDTNTYTFYSDTYGNICMTINNTSPTQGQNSDAYSYVGDMLEQRTLVRSKLEKAVERNAGNDATALTGTQWYNEAFDGITIMKQQTKIIVGYVDPSERKQVLDPKLIPKSMGQRTLFSNYFLSQFKTRDYSASYNEQYVVGEFKNNKVKMNDLDQLFYSRKFWIPNVTTQDLH